MRKHEGKSDLDRETFAARLVARSRYASEKERGSKRIEWTRMNSRVMSASGYIILLFPDFLYSTYRRGSVPLQVGEKKPRDELSMAASRLRERQEVLRERVAINVKAFPLRRRSNVKVNGLRLQP